ncbi:torsin-1B-like [Diabrotica undecimpunctata]|uniref:torsin-1B-like n=1 Tax=Diabrotica undecimpunctata TaxID=50387 RepID=UPI003B63E615
MLKVILLLIYVQLSLCWNFDVRCLYVDCDESNSNTQKFNIGEKLQTYNPYCLVFDCKKENINSENQKNDHMPSIEPEHDSEIINRLKKYNPYCLVFDCKEDKLNTENVNPNTKSVPDTSSNLDKGLYCSLFGCEEVNRDPENKEVESKSKWNPYCWFNNCYQSNKDSETEQAKFWHYDYWANKDKEGDLKSWTDRFYCSFKDCSKEMDDSQNVESRFTISGIYNSAKDYLNAAKPQDIVADNVFSSEISPYCWFTECCNSNTIPGDIQKLSSLLKTKLYGQPLASTVIDAISPHWNTNHPSRKALVLSLHGPIGTGKNYISEMIAQSLFKLGVQSKYVHYFSGRLHFNQGGNSDIYKQNLYSWLKGNVTSCSKQLFIFHDADNMPEQLLNSILPMLDYREKVDGADYRNAIFMFLSNSGSQLIIDKLNDLYNQNKTRADVELEDFEKVIIKDIFNHQGGFYHSDTISHNLIDHYIPLLPMERTHVAECIIDQFKERNVDSPTEEHVTSILNSMSWVQTEHFEYSLTGCKAIGSKVRNLWEKYYRPKQQENADL